MLTRCELHIPLDESFNRRRPPHKKRLFLYRHWQPRLMCAAQIITVLLLIVLFIYMVYFGKRISEIESRFNLFIRTQDPNVNYTMHGDVMRSNGDETKNITLAFLHMTARAVSPNSVLVQWYLPDVSNTTITGYIVHYKLSTTDSWHNLTVPVVNVAMVYGLQSHSTYHMKVEAVGEINVLSNTVAVITTTGVPAQLSSLEAEVIGPDRILLSWDEPINSSHVTGYTIEYNSSIESNEVQLENPVQSFTLSQLEPDTLYSLRIAARSERGLGPYSWEVQAKTMPLGNGHTIATTDEKTNVIK